MVCPSFPGNSWKKPGVIVTLANTHQFELFRMYPTFFLSVTLRVVRNSEEKKHVLKCIQQFFSPE